MPQAELVEQSASNEQQVIDEHAWDASHEKVADICPEEASVISEQLWASGVTHCMAHMPSTLGTFAERSCRKLLLTFQRYSPLLQEALLKSVPALAAIEQGIDVQPEWANGGKVFITAELEDLRSVLGDAQLRPWHLLIHEKDEVKIFDAIDHLPYTFKKLKHEVGRIVIPEPDLDEASRVASPDEDRRVLEIEVSRTFIHLSDESAIGAKSSKSW